MTAPADLLADALRDRYSLGRELGRGGMATVYLATDLKLQRQVALKVLRPELGVALGTDRFVREIQIASQLNHPHILALHDSGEAGGHLYYAMPYVEGESLRQRLEREGQLPIAEVVTIVRAVASALTYAHQQGFIHRDIKPENILLSTNGAANASHPLVADFGIARALDKAGGDRLTETGLALGTPAYMSPEQAAAGTRLDGRSDIYALGCVAYEMLAGAPPFTGPTAQSIMARHAVDPVPPLHTVRATVSAPVEYAITRALAKVPADRFTTANEFADALMADHVPASIRRRSLPRRIRLGLGVGVGVGAATAGIAGMMLHSSAAPTVMPSATRIAVLPFLSPSSDTALARLGRDLAVTISATLDGVGEVKTADRLSLANATADKQSVSPAEGATLARQLGASSFLRGTLVRAGDEIRVDAGLYSTDGLAPLADAITVTGHRDSVGALTDSVTWALLRRVWQRGETPSPSLSAVTTGSLPALRAFLEGERKQVTSDWDGASLAYRSAMTADSTFWLAYFGYALSRFWTGQPVEPEVMDALQRNRESLPERERLLVDGFLVSDRTPRAKIEAYRMVTQRFPQYWPGWFLYADILFHAGPISGYDWSESLDAFRRVVALNPKLVPAWEHIGDLATGRDRAEASRARAHLFALGYPPPGHPGFGRFVRLVDAVDSTGGVIPHNIDTLADSMAQFSAFSGDEQLAIGSPLDLLQRGFPIAQLDLNRRRLALSHLRVPVQAANLAGSAWSWATRGQWDSALVIMDEAVAAYQGSVGWMLLPVENYAMSVLGAWLGTVDPIEADRRRVGAITALAGVTDKGKVPRTLLRETRGRLAWLDGLLGFARRDRRAVQTARAEAARSGYFRSDLIDRSLAAFDKALAGDRKGAGRELARLEEECIGDENCPSMTPHIAVQRMMAAEWLREVGEAEAARRLLRWQDVPWLGWPWTFNDGVSGPAFLMRARIEETSGTPRRAREYYEQFLRRYDRPMPAQRHLVDEAKAALARAQPDP